MISRERKTHCGYFISIVAAMLAASAAVARGEPETLLELYTSQSCYSCPAAEKLLADKYVDRPGVLALELHVDYWDDLVYGSAGQWKDPYSDPRYTSRQQAYARVFRKASVFTPQIIVQGAYALSGTAERQIDAAIDKVADFVGGDGWGVEFSSEAGRMSAAVVTGDGEADVIVAKYLSSTTTKILAGENRGKVLLNNNVVVGWAAQGRARKGMQFAVGDLGTGESCAVILQRPKLGIVLGVWRCPQA